MTALNDADRATFRRADGRQNASAPRTSPVRLDPADERGALARTASNLPGWFPSRRFISAVAAIGGMQLLATMDSTDVTSIRTIGTLLDAYNNGGDGTTIVIPGSLTIGKADPTGARTLAQLKAGDC